MTAADMAKLHEALQKATGNQGSLKGTVDMNADSMAKALLALKQEEGDARRAVYLTRGFGGPTRVVGHPNFGRSFLGCIEADLCN